MRSFSEFDSYIKETNLTKCRKLPLAEHALVLLSWFGSGSARISGFLYFVLLGLRKNVGTFFTWVRASLQLRLRCRGPLAFQTKRPDGDFKI